MRKTTSPSPEELKSLVSNVSRLSTLLTRERESLPPAYLKDPGLRNAYVRYYLPANEKKVQLALSELALHPGGLLPQDRLRVLDLGAGPGTALLGMLAFFLRQPRRPSLSCTAVDRVAENLRAAGELFAAYCADNSIQAALVPVRAELEGIERAVEGTFDLILMSNVLCELFPLDEDRVNKRTGFVRAVLSRLLSDTGSCIIIEPALRETSRELLAVRDGLAAEGFSVYAPCLATLACPARANPKDWCHEDIPWDPPSLIREIDRLTGLRKDSLKFSYLVLRKDGRSLADLFGRDCFRVVSEPLRSKGKIEFYICGTGGRKMITRLDKDRTEANRLFEEMKRGAIVGFERLIDEGKRFKVGPETEIIIHKHET